MEVVMEAVIIEAEVIEALRSCFDPEIPVNIYELGLIYDVKVDPSGVVGIRMTLTSPSCPAAQSLPAEVQTKARGVRGVTDVTVDVVWDPPWEPSKMSEAAKLQLGFM
jgi:FeS assembly SUF system protein